MIEQIPGYYAMHLTRPEALNQALLQGYLRYVDNVSVRRTHFYEGRYENMYIDRDKIPELDNILNHACTAAVDILKLPAAALRAGLWFNAMPAGSRTLRHAHDDDDELLSAVYYVTVPENSGQLLLHTKDFCTHVVPRPGMFVFFPPYVQHEVTENASTDLRLSLGINIGPVTTID